MAFAVTSYNVYATETAKAVSPEVTQYIKFTVTAANTDVAYDLATVGGTFWTAAGGSTAGAAFTSAAAAFTCAGVVAALALA